MSSEELNHKDEVRRQFGATASDYVTSSAHASGHDLELLASWSEGGPDRSLLDVATGGGHTALRLSSLYGRVVASDITQEMLAAAERFVRAEGRENIEFVVADAESLPMEDETFDAVSCRIAPHHFPHPDRFVAEAFRVLRSGGIFLFEDSITPDDHVLSDVLNTVEHLRDPTHVRSLTQPEWIVLVTQAGFSLEESAIDRKRHDLSDWMDRSRTPYARRQKIQEILIRAGEPAAIAFGLEFDDGTCVAFTDEKLLLKARNLQLPA